MTKSKPKKVIYKNQCLDCGKPFNLTSTGMKKVKGGYICDDCHDIIWNRLHDEDPVEISKMYRGV